MILSGDELSAYTRGVQPFVKTGPHHIGRSCYGPHFFIILQKRIISRNIFTSINI